MPVCNEAIVQPARRAPIRPHASPPPAPAPPTHPGTPAPLDRAVEPSDPLAGLLAGAVLQRATVASRGAAPAATVQRTLADARSAVYERFYATNSAAPVGLQVRSTFDATFDTWEKLQALEHRFSPREWSRIRFLYSQGRAVPPPPPPRRGPAPPPSPPPLIRTGASAALAPPRRAPSKEESEQVRRRGQIAHVMLGCDLLVYEFTAEIELQKRYRPSEILANQMTLVMGGVAKILLGAIQVGTAGLSAPVTGALIGLVDLGTSGARSGLGLDSDDGGDAQATSATKSLMVTSATKAVGPVLPFSLGPGYQAASAVPVVGGVAAMALGAKDVWDGLKGIQLSANDLVFMKQSLVEIGSMKARISAKAEEMAPFPELRGAATRWRACVDALTVVEGHLTGLLAKHMPSASAKVAPEPDWAPVTRPRSGAPAPLPTPA